MHESDDEDLLTNHIPSDSETNQTLQNGSAFGRHGMYHGTTPPAGSTEGYEEFFGGTIPCPSCRGTGRIPRDKENELVALIPLSDKRLKPRRTTCYVLLAIFVCLVIGGLLAFFLFPRGVRLMSNNPTLQPVYLYVNTTEDVVYMTIVNVYNVSNDNYYAVQADNLTVTLTFDEHIISTGLNKTDITVPLKTVQAYEVQLNVSFSGDEGYIAHYCGDDVRRPHTLLMPFQASLKSSYFGGTFENTLTTFQHVRCTNKKIPS